MARATRCSKGFELDPGVDLFSEGVFISVFRLFGRYKVWCAASIEVEMRKTQLGCRTGRVRYLIGESRQNRRLCYLSRCFGGATDWYRRGSPSQNFAG